MCADVEVFSVILEQFAGVSCALCGRVIVGLMNTGTTHTNSTAKDKANKVHCSTS